MNYKDGRTLKNYYCLDCGKLISDYRAKRCKKCFGIKRTKSHHCKDCKKEISREAIRCLSCNNRLTMKKLLTKGIKFHPAFIDGSSFKSYSIKWTKKLKESIRKRDNYECQNCGIKEINYYRKLDVHHIDYNKKNCNEENLITLCHDCHLKTNRNRRK